MTNHPTPPVCDAREIEDNCRRAAVLINKSQV
jgi:hypothetical protein